MVVIILTGMTNSQPHVTLSVPSQSSGYFQQRMKFPSMLSLEINFTSRRQKLYQKEKWELAQAFVRVLFVCKSKRVFFVRKMNFILMVPMDLSKSHNCHSSHAPHWDNKRMQWPLQIGCGEGCAFKNISTSPSHPDPHRHADDLYCRVSNTSRWYWRGWDGSSLAWGDPELQGLVSFPDLVAYLSL